MAAGAKLSREPRAGGDSRRALLAVTVLFFLSGAAGLVYQVLWMRSLGLFLGSDLYALSIILSSFMGGLALGSLAGGRLAERVSRPLFWYGVAEVGIGLFALLFASILAAFDPILRAAYPSGDAGSWLYQGIRIGTAVLVLLAPTTLMGATLPLILKHFVRSRSVLGEMAGYFYAVNTLGALAGTAVAGFVLLPYLGMSATTLGAASLNLLIGGCCLVIGARIAPPPFAGAHEDEAASLVLDPLPGLSDAQRARIARAALIALGLSGFGSFSLEVLWTRILVISSSATVYSFTAMLCSFLLGIFLGSTLVSTRVDEHPAPLRLFAGLELGVAVSLAILCLAVNATPDVFGRLLGGVSTLVAPEHALVLTTLGVSLLVLIVPTTLLGATFAVALRAYTTSVAQVGLRSGNLYFSNTLGAILGSLFAGLVLVPAFGLKVTLAGIALLFLATGIMLEWAHAEGRLVGKAGLRSLVAAGVTLLGVGVALAAPYRVALNFNQNTGIDTELLYHQDGVQSTIDVVRSASGVTTLIIGGNIEANDEPTQLRHFILKAHLPLLFLEHPGEVLVVGLGMGITLDATTRHTGVERIQVVELSPEIVEAQEYLRDVNGDILSNPLVEVRIDDGRSFMKMSSGRYDMITADPIHPKISRVGYLYTREYYEMIRSRLRSGGIVCQWMPLYQISPARLRSAVKSFAAVFPNAMLWHVKNHALLVATKDAPSIDYPLLARKFEQPSVREDLARIGIDSPEELMSLLLMGPAEIQAFVERGPGVPDNTDDYPYLEYFVPSDLFYDERDNLREMLMHLVDPIALLRDVPSESEAIIRRLSDGRARQLMESTVPR